MSKYYSDEKNVQILIALLKAHGIKNVIASPGTTNSALVASLQTDDYFNMRSAVDERSAAYMACGLANELGVPVVISCTGATASRNYLPGLTEAYYRKLPVLAITSHQGFSKVGHLMAQVIDRSSLPNDVTHLSVELPVIKDQGDVWDCEIKVNKAILQLKRNGGGTAHINIPTIYSQSYETKELPSVRVIDRIVPASDFPDLPSGRIAVAVGAHVSFSQSATTAIDRFCEVNDAVVFCDHTSSYKGKYRVLYSLAASQESCQYPENFADLLIHIGEVTGDYSMLKMASKDVWRVSEDGEIRDTFNRLKYVFQMPEAAFFEYYSKGQVAPDANYLNRCKAKLEELYTKMPEMPLSNVWLASQMAHRIPEGSTILFGILNSLRSWNFFELPNSVVSACNVGGFGIDGNMSSLLGASLANSEKLYFGVIGDLAFFYDMNCLGNRHVGANLRILLVNNGKGTEFRQYNHHVSHLGLGESADEFVAAGGHFGQKSPVLVKHYAEDLGFDYIKASSKEEFEQVYEQFLAPELSGKPILFEVFTDSDDESQALRLISNIEENTKGKAKGLARQVLGDSGFKKLKKVLGK